MKIGAEQNAGAYRRYRAESTAQRWPRKKSMDLRRKRFWKGFCVCLVVFVVANGMSLVCRTDGGLHTLLGTHIVTMDAITRMGFPFVVWQNGDFVGAPIFSPLMLFWNLAIAFAASFGVGAVLSVKTKAPGNSPG